MLQHLSVLSSIINLIAGTAIVIYLFGAYRQTKFPYLKTLAWHSIFFNMLVSAQLFKRYVTVTNLRVDDNSFFTADMGGAFNIILILLTAAMFYFLILTVIKLKNLSHRFISILLYSFTVTLLVIYAVINLVALSKGLENVFNFFLDNSLFLFILVEILLLVSMFFERGSAISRRIKRSFSAFYISRYPLFLIPIIVTKEYRWLVTFCVILYINLIPLFWTKLFLLKYKPGLLSFIENKKPLKEIFDSYELTGREQEIVKLIIDGLSNREIKEKLFISSNTVKNHLYNIYQKIGVKNRYEMIHIFTKIKDNSGNSN